MQHELVTEIDIHAPIDRVWSVLTDFAAYAQWNPLVVRAQGELALGSRLSIALRLRGPRAIPIHPKVVDLAPGTRFAWLGGLGIPGLFDGRHRFELAPLGPDRVRFTHAEQFSGILVALLRRSLDTTARRGFEAMNEALKARCEGVPR